MDINPRFNRDRGATRQYTYVIFTCGEQYAHDEVATFGGETIVVTDTEVLVDGIVVAKHTDSGWYLQEGARQAGNRFLRYGRIAYCLQNEVPFSNLNTDATFAEMMAYRNLGKSAHYREMLTNEG